MGPPMTIVADPVLVDPLVQLAPVQTESDGVHWITDFALQLSHRFAIVAFLAAVATGVLLFKASGAFGYALVTAALTSDVAIVLAGVALILARRRPVCRSEARGLLLFNGIIFAVAIYTMVFTRLTWIRIAIHPLTAAPQDVELPK
jgi:hypothetical protein